VVLGRRHRAGHADDAGGAQAFSSNINDHFPPQIYNIGRDDDYVSMLEIAERAVDLANASSSLIKLVEPPYAQTVVKRLSTEKIRSLGWKPEIPLDEGMRIVYDWIAQFDREGQMVV
jgi:GDP-L-fucose synthase